MNFLKDSSTDRFCLACRISSAICRTATTKTLVASFLLWLVFLVLIMGRPFGIAQLQEITGGPTIPDMTFTTGPDSVYAVLGALGAAGRTFDLGYIVPLDLIFPFTYALFLSLGISWGLARLLQKGNPSQLLNLAPLCAAAADYCENAGVITLLLTYPSRFDVVAWWTSVMYVIKFVFSTLSWVVFMTAVAIWLVVVVNKKIRNPGRTT